MIVDIQAWTMFGGILHAVPLSHGTAATARNRTPGLGIGGTGKDSSH
ncbi:hypothetical protein CupriaWKF_23445 [Cupriavidus sp. WKF15]|nr:hypothetical protein [Cupriavidus sp. WKF15]WER50055.1 hypothetical protein CupriaWKF_23445 [Cupriavidus sp. WKF15]